MTSTDRHLLRRSRSRRWTAAALLVALAGAGWWWAGLVSWQGHALGVLEEVGAARAKFDRELPEPDQLVAWLQERSAPVLPTLPDALAARPALGAKTWEWRGLNFAMLSFRLEETATAHLISTWHGGLKGAPPLGHMIHAHRGKWSTATWSEGGLACLLATDAGEAALHKLLAAVQGAGAPPPRVASTGRARPYSWP